MHKFELAAGHCGPYKETRIVHLNFPLYLNVFSSFHVVFVMPAAHSDILSPTSTMTFVGRVTIIIHAVIQ